jgi:hypothetical protein
MGIHLREMYVNRQNNHQIINIEPANTSEELIDGQLITRFSSIKTHDDIDSLLKADENSPSFRRNASSNFEMRGSEQLQV